VTAARGRAKKIARAKGLVLLSVGVLPYLLSGTAMNAITQKSRSFLYPKGAGMIKSEWKCPNCKQSLFVTGSARYWCSQCQAEKDSAQVDPMDRDYVRLTIVFDQAIERELGVSFERVDI
jgi:hypothetical protein